MVIQITTFVLADDKADSNLNLFQNWSTFV